MPDLTNEDLSEKLIRGGVDLSLWESGGKGWVFRVSSRFNWAGATSHHCPVEDTVLARSR